MHADLPALEGVGMASGPVPGPVAALLAEERALIAKAPEARRGQFAAGRAAARRAMLAIGLEAAPVLRGEAREPLWPAGVCGSITHAGDVAAAVVGRSDRFRGLGIDLEEHDRVTPTVHPKRFTPGERGSFDRADPRLPGLLFSAKEAGYKATFPTGRRFIGFHEAEVDVDWSSRTFRLRYLGDHEPNAIMGEGVGHFAFRGRYVLSLVIIPSRP